MAGLRSTNSDARMQFQWRLEIPGVNIASWKECNLPDSEFDAPMYNGGNIDIKQPGRRKFSDITAKRILSSVGPDLSVSQWHDQCGDAETGVALPPSSVKRDGVLLHLASDGIAIIETFKVTGIWPKKISGMKMNGTSEIQYEEITFSVDTVKRTP